MDITDAEYEVMRVVWAEGETTSRHIGDVLEEELGWTSSTTKTLINRLKNKGYLEAEEEGRKYIYSAGITEKEAIFSRIQGVFSNVCNTSEGPILKDLVQVADLSKENIRDIISLLEERLETAPDTVTCTCPPGQCEHHKYESHG